MAKVFQRPIAVALDSSAWTLTGAATKEAAVDDLIGQPDDGASYLECATTPGGEERIAFLFPPIPEAVSVVQVEIHLRSEEQGGVANHAPYLLRNGSNIDGVGLSLPAGVYTDHFDTWPTDPATGLAWSKAAVDATPAGVVQAAATALARLTQIYRVVEFVPFSAKAGAALEVGSRIIRLLRNELWLPEITGPLTWGDLEIFEDGLYSDPYYPDALGAGKGSEVWQRAGVRVLSSAFNLDEMSVTLGTFDLLGFLCHLWDAGAAEAAAGSAPSSRPAHADPGALRFYQRETKAWPESGAAAAQGGTQLIEVGADVELVELPGNLIEEERTNDLLYSGFSAGAFTGWTVTGNVVADTGDLLFVPEVSTQSAKFARAGSANCRLAQAPAAYAGSEVLTLATWHKDDSGAALSWSLQRSTDSFYWNDSTAAWQVGFVANAYTVRSTPYRDVSKPIVLSAAAQTLTLTYYAEAAADQVNHAYHAQLGQGRYATSVIFTTSAVATRAASILRMENDSDNGRCWITNQGTAGVTFTPEASTDASIAEDQVLYNTSDTGDGVDYDRVYYRHSTGLMCFERKNGDDTFTATKAFTLVRGTPVHVVARATGAAGELGLAPNTLSIFVNGVKGTDVVANSTARNGPWLDLGCAEQPADTIAQFAGGHLADMNVIPQVLPDEIIAGGWR
ncbi:MAG TPA: hypothetical protein VJ735_20095 [Actinomycetes bacterium]|nr:hypothetical protein [Actinomycetes bacterium]